MANKFIVFVVFAAVAQASSALSVEESLALEIAEEGTRAEWYLMGDTVCRLTQDASLTIEAAQKQLSLNQANGMKYFMEVAPLSNDLALQEEIESLAEVFPAALSEETAAARNCTNFATIKTQIENYTKQLPYERLVEAFHDSTGDTGSSNPAVEALKTIYDTFFNEIGKLAESLCGGAGTVESCATQEIRQNIDALIKIIYSWLGKTE